MSFFNLILSIALLFCGISGLIYTFKMDRNKQKQIADNGDMFSAILSVIPLYLFKVILFLLSLIPLGIVTGMWLQFFKIIE